MVKRAFLVLLQLLLLCVASLSGCTFAPAAKTETLPSGDSAIVEQVLSAMSESGAIFSESEGVLRLRRRAVDHVAAITEGSMTALAGYQNALGADDANIAVNTYVQMVGLQAAISEMGVRYNWGAFSLGSSLNQRVLLSDYVLDSESGICIETSMLLASAIQSTHMHPMIIFTPGHAQVAVETWRDSGQYFLMETTTLPFDWRTDDWSGFITFLSAEEWADYMQSAVEGGLGYVVDCDLVNVLGIQGIGY